MFASQHTRLVLRSIGFAFALPALAQGPLAPQLLDSPTSANSAVVADFDRDGRNDIAAASSSALYVLFARGQGTFAAPVSVSLPAIASTGAELVTGDFDGDGATDIAVGSGYYYLPGGRLHIVRNVGGTFVVSATVALTSGVNALVARDFDGDGKLDLAATSASNASLILARGDGAGGLFAPVTLPLAAVPTDLEAADLDHDGDLDLVYARQDGGFGVLLDQGNMVFTAGQSVALNSYSNAIALGDFDGDLDIDIVLDRGGLQLWRNDGLATFAGQALFGQVQVARLSAIDVDGDGKLDLVGSDGAQAGTVDAALNLGGGTFGPFRRQKGLSSAGPLFGFAELDGDGKLDCVEAGPTGVLLMHGNGSGAFGSPRLALPSVGSKFAAADFDGDGRPDIAAVSGVVAPYTLSCSLHQPSGAFTTSVISTTLPEISTMCAGDFNGDGKADLVLIQFTGTMKTYLGNGSGGFAAPLVATCGYGCTLCAAADVTGDGMDDVVMAGPWGAIPPFNQYWGWIGYQAATGSGSFTPSGFGGSYGSFISVNELATADFNADGRSDVALTTDVGCVVFTSSGGTGFTVQTLLSNTFLQGLAATRLDSNSTVDLLLTAFNTPQAWVALGNGAGSFALSPPIAIGQNAERTAAADFDNDGDGDVALLGANGVVQLLVGDGSGALALHPARFSAEVSTDAPIGRCLAFDADLDGRMDLACLDDKLASITFAVQQSVWEQPDVYCTAKTTSNGCVPSIASSGTPSASATSGFSITCSNVINQKNGLLFYSLTGRRAVPFQGGTMCVLTPIARTPLQNSAGNPPPDDCSGTFAIDMNAFAHGLAGGSPQPALLVQGTAVTAQGWGRDPGSPSATMLSNAIEYLVGP